MTRQIKLMIVVLAVLLGACGKNYFSINNTNPNQVTNLPPMTLMAGVLNQTASIVTTDFPFLGCYQGYWTITQGFSDITDYANYNYSTNFGQNIWTDLYGNLGNITYIETAAATDSTLVLFGAMAKIMKALHYQMLVDVYNDVPYKQASNPLILYPKYDSAQTIYEDIILKIDTAIGMINSASPLTALQPDVTNDIMFGGNMTLWKQFANTLKLRILLHQSQIDKRSRVVYSDCSYRTLLAPREMGSCPRGRMRGLIRGIRRTTISRIPGMRLSGLRLRGGHRVIIPVSRRRIMGSISIRIRMMYGSGMIILPWPAMASPLTSM